MNISKSHFSFYLSYLIIFVLNGCTDDVHSLEAGDISKSEVVSNQYAVNTMADLKGFNNPDDNVMILLKGYYSPNDGGGGLFYWDSYSRAENNDGTVVKINNIEIGRFYRVHEKNRLNVKWFGAKGDGVHDDHLQIQTAINSLPDNGGTVSIPGGKYLVSATIDIGNGDWGQVPSIKHGIKLVGEGGGFACPASTSIVATNAMPAVIDMKGRIASCHMEDIFIDGNSNAEIGLRLTAISGCVFRNLKIIGYTNKGLAILGGSLPTGNYNIFNRFESINVVSVIDNTTCLFIDGDYNAINDTWLSTFVGCRFDTHTTANSKAGHFKFVDSISFYRCHFVGTNKNSSVGMIFDALNNHDYPCGMAFYDCSIISTDVWEDATHQIRKNYFYGYGTYDNEQLPSHKKLVGFTDEGLPFNLSAIFTTGGLPPLTGEFDTYRHAGFNHIKMNEANETVAIRFNAGGRFAGGKFYLASYGDNTGTINMSIYEWNTDYERTVSGSVIYHASFVDFTDNTWVNFNIEENLPTTEYLILFHDCTDINYGVGLWTKAKAIGIISYHNGIEADFGIIGQLYVE